MESFVQSGGPRVVALTTLCLPLSISNDRATWRDTPQDCATWHDPTAESACHTLGRGNSFFQRFFNEPPDVYFRVYQLPACLPAWLAGWLRFSTGHDRATWHDPTVAAVGGL